MPDDFYEDDEPVDYVVAAFDAGEKGVTQTPAGQTVNLNLPTADVGKAWAKHLGDMAATIDAIDEIASVRQELDDTKADLSRMVDQLAEANGRLIKAREQRDTWRTMHHEVETERDHLRAHGFTEDYIHGLRDDLADAEQQLGLRTTELDVLRAAALRVVQLYRLGNEMATVVAVDRLGEVLDGGT